MTIEEEALIIPRNNYLSTCNNGVNEGFGEQYVRLQDLRLGDVNQPIRKPFSLHFLTAVLNIGAVWIVIHDIWYFVRRDIESWSEVTLGFAAYFGYLVWMYTRGGTFVYLRNIRPFADYKTIFRNTHQTEGFFVFGIRCYNERERVDEDRKATYVYKQNYQLDQCIDSSGDSVRQLQYVRRTVFTFVEYSRNFRFLNDGTKYRVIRAFNQFARVNRRDRYQEYEFQFQLRDQNSHVCYSNINKTVILAIFHIFVMIGLGFAISMLIELLVKRYEVKIIKTLAKNA